ncbi:MAG TPA: DnaA/Hda family protein [Beijerinckiaceae bacterium]|nr:DnaA/Hda family protein [Beijerinckiaceae bacterium]
MARPVRPRPPRPPAQLPLDLALAPQFGEEDFLVGPSNEAAHDFMTLWPDWPARIALLTGPAGSGKTHLAHIWSARSGARLLAASRIGDVSPAMLTDAPALAIDGCDTGTFDEARLFHIINLVHERGRTLLLTARRQPDLWGIATADLLSRLRLAPATAIAGPDDGLLRAVMVKQFLDRQLTVDVSVVEFVVARIERSFAAVRSVVDALDREALALGRRITRPVAAAVLERIAPS